MRRCLYAGWVPPSVSAASQAHSSASAGNGLPLKSSVDDVQQDSASEALAEDGHQIPRADPKLEEGNTGGSDEDEGKQGTDLQHPLQ